MVNCHLINKSFGKVKALTDISFSVNKAEIFGIIGPDGAGKTTLFRILTTLLLPDSGTAHVNGLNVIDKFKDIRESVGYMPGKFSLYQDLSVEENINFFATVFNTSVEENYHLIKDIYCQLEPFKKRRAGKLSGGMKQKLALCCALIHSPVVLFLDEPTTGVDAVSRKEFWEMLRNLKKNGITIIVSTPYMDEAALCDRIALIQTGTFLKIDTPENIVKDFSKKIYAIRSNNMSKLLKDLRNINGVQSCFAFGDSHHVTVDENLFNKDLFYSVLNSEGHENIEVESINPCVEDCFMELSTK